MKWITILLLFIHAASISAQDLYLKFKTETTDKAVILNKYVSNTSFQDFSTLKVFLNDFAAKLQYEGFLNSRLAKPVPLNDSVFLVKVKLRKKYNTLFIKNLSDYPDIKEDIESYISVKELPNTIELLLNKYAEAGKPFSMIQFEDIEFEKSDTVAANLMMKVSEERNLDEVVLRGYDKFPQAFMKNYANIKQGMVFNKSKLIKESEKLNTLKFANQTKSPQVQFTKDSTKLFIYLEKKQANSFDGFIGFNNSDENEFQLNGNIDLTLINNFHGGEEINLNYKNDGNAQEWFNADVRLPYLFNTRFTLGAGLGFFKQDSIFSNTTQHLKLDYQISSNINIGFNAAFENSSNLLDDDEIREDIQDYKKNRFGTSIIYDRSKRFSNLFLSAQNISLNLGIGNRTTNTLEETQQYFEIRGRQIFKISKRQYIYAGIQAGYLDSDSYLSNELYRFGGVNSIRGFVENRFFANLYGTIQTEYRYILGSNLYVHSVLDYGFYENEIDRTNENLYSLGFGIGLETKAGVLRLIFANGGSDSQNIEFKNTQIHLKLLSLF